MRSVAVRLASEAAEFVRHRRGSVDWTASVRTKSSETDPVTLVDTDCERLLRKRLASLRPDDAILGEEDGESAGGASPEGAGQPSGVRWVIDPIDGTVNFVYGIPAYAVSVAAQLDGQTVAGAVADVVADRVFSAASGGGATVREANGLQRELVCNPVRETQLALVATGFAYSAVRRARQAQLVAQLLPRVRDVRRIGSAALDLCGVAEGRVDAQYEHGLGPWDWAAGALIAREAGAVVILPGVDARSADGALIAAMAPGIAEGFGQLLTDIGAIAPIPG
ncbi:inositol monophosphatase family protein [Mycobacteroides immunogenum]|uniref:Inositol-1-monophosphatase n=1 Tax=Mycobacteroides immunogenum TaxID=83262 RepID=A0A7V8LSV7_9MYCO|nr:inositol monophosphatase family protein [Mycobacteroides immunogenum]AMT73881.1 inositol monophosphatase [Mycobacteroides immunogenum]ANO07060.1 inositol monophosphatase [Mycobacteroides immunogenum]KIU40080.1 inositol monophosphatase [Mycobacteroides immunogenum]KPG15395.1 inositol monophosphatase [Mycobacteroides immunogenum]KPG16009.1 inositol monophosphatase [Mycobacteroides immunogenum]